MDSMFGPWRYRPDNLTLEMSGAEYPGGSNPYYIDLERCGTPEEMLDWIFQIARKTWATPAVVSGMVAAFQELLDPQATLCSFGRRKVIPDVAKLLGERSAR